MWSGLNWDKKVRIKGEWNTLATRAARSQRSQTPLRGSCERPDPSPRL
jgi:hypothetical protein